MAQVNLPKRFGWVGVGAMGFPFALNLRKKIPKAAELFVYDISQAALEQFKKDASEYGSVTLCSSAKEVAEHAEFILSIVPEGKHVRQVYLDPHSGLLAVPAGSKTFIDCSTIDMATSAEVGLAVQISSGSASFFDAPVSGGPARALAGVQTIMIGISEDDRRYPLVKAVLSMIGTSLFPCGGPTLGLVAKLSNNYVSGLTAIATSEGMNMAMRHGMDPRVLSKIFSTSTAQSYINDVMNPVPGVCPDAPSSKDYQGGFKVQYMRKDFALALDAAKAAGAKLMLGEAGLATYSGASEDPNCRDRDSRVVYRWLGGKERY